jgi:DnaJ-class molecular chaperone
MKYFFDCKTIEEAKARYRKLAMELHPDHGGSNAEMIELSRQYDAFLAEIEKVHPYDESIKEAFEEAKQREKYYKGFGYTSGYWYRPSSAANDAYFNSERQSLYKEINEYKEALYHVKRAKEQLVDIVSAQKQEIAELKKNFVVSEEKIQYWQEINKLLQAQNHRLRKQRSLWNWIRTAFATLKGLKQNER